MPKKVIFSLVPLFILGGVFAIISSERSPESLVNIPLAEKHRGVCWVGGPDEVFAENLATLADKNVNWISQTPFGWQRGHDNPEIGMNNGKDWVWWGERDLGLKKTTEFAQANGIKTILKPHIWLRDDQGKWRGEIKMKSEEDWQKWFAHYTEFILHYARLAEEANMEMLCIGTELHQTCVEREADWRQLISKVREVYSGPLTYAANFSDEYQDVSFWDDLDYIGVQAYFPLTDALEPDIEALREGWKEPIEALRKFSNRYEKPILFTEVGYKSTNDAGITPWEWPQRISQEEREEIYSEETQARCYEALFAEVMDEPWLAGVHLWKWYPRYDILKERNEKRMRNYFNIDFTPQKKAAEQVMTDWFAKMK